MQLNLTTNRTLVILDALDALAEKNQNTLTSAQRKDNITIGEAESLRAELEAITGLK